MPSNGQQAAAKPAGPSEEELHKKWEEYVNKIHYSDKYNDDKYEYRHVILPKPLMKYIPKKFYNNDDSGTLRLLNDAEWRSIGIQQSLGWVHYEVHAPEPHVLLFRRELDFRPPQTAVTNNGRQTQANGKSKK